MNTLEDADHTWEWWFPATSAYSGALAALGEHSQPHVPDPARDCCSCSLPALPSPPELWWMWLLSLFFSQRGALTPSVLKVGNLARKKKLQLRFIESYKPVVACVGRELEFHLIPAPCHGQRHLSLDQVAPSPPACLERFQGWGIQSCSGEPVPVSHQYSLELFEQIQWNEMKANLLRKLLKCLKNLWCEGQ